MKTAGPRQDPAVICYALDGLVGIIGQHLHQFLAGKEDAALPSLTVKFCNRLLSNTLSSARWVCDTTFALVPGFSAGFLTR